MRKTIFIIILISLMFSTQVTKSCTIFTIRSDTEAYFGSNEDYLYDNTFITFKPGNETTYGVAFLGFHNNNNFIGNNYPQGGYNTKGLAFDVNALPPVPLNNHSTDRVSNPEGYVLENILKYCKDVPEVIQWFQTHDFNMSAISGQFHYADANGNATVISGYDGEWTFTNIGNASYLISTNYNLANISNGEYPSWRYNNAALLLQQVDPENISEESLINVLSSTHQEGEAHTIYSFLVNLKTLDISLFYEHDFTQMKKFNLQTELTQGEHTYDLGQLFKKSTTPNNIIGLDTILILICFVGILGLRKVKKFFIEKKD